MHRYVKNLAKPLTKEDQKLRRELKSGARGLRQIERDIREAGGPGGELCSEDTQSLLDICTAVRSVLKDNAKPPFEPPGLRLFEGWNVTSTGPPGPLSMESPASSTS